MTEDDTARLAELLREAKEAHGEAFAHVGGEDDEWPRWYADYIVERASEVLGTDLDPADLAEAVAEADRAHTAASERPWPEAYADHLRARYGEA